MSLTAPETLHGFRNVASIEQEALSIHDPIRRLRYLREATSGVGSTATTIVSAPLQRRWGPIASLCMVALLLSMRSDAHLRHTAGAPEPVKVVAKVVIPEAPKVWIIEATPAYEIYSNGLRIENQLAVSNKPRSYQLVRRGNDPEGTVQKTGTLGTQPAGIVFHTTESHQADFAPEQQQALRRIGQETLLFVRNKLAYHFVIDRFGRVHRIVVESDAANHAGKSVWADSEWVYLEPNQSFLGVAFEASMRTDQRPINEAQIHSAKVLTEMLRVKYRIAAENCVTHAQVSVNPDNMRMGWHSDWGKGFPFREIGLPENYEQPVPGLYLFGFDYDPVYVNATGPGIWKGLALAEERLQEASGRRRVALAEYRAHLQQRYRDEIAALQPKSTEEGN